MSMDSPPARFNGPAAPYSSVQQYSLNSRMMIAAIIVLFVVVFFILVLHIYAKWFWRRSARRSSASWPRRNRLDFAAGSDIPGLHRPSVGLDKSILESLPVFSYKLPSNEEEPLLECAVCLCEFEEGEQGRLLPSCSHSFHTGCIDMWFHSHATCPLCRTIVSAAEMSPCMKAQEEGSQGEDEGGAAAFPVQLPLPYPNNVLFWGNHNHVSSQLSSPGMGSGGSSSTRSLPHISIEIPRRLDSFPASRHMSLSLSRCPSVDIDQAACSSSLKSPSLRLSIKRLLSRERSRGRSRVSPAADGRECGGDEQEVEALRANADVTA